MVCRSFLRHFKAVEVMVKLRMHVYIPDTCFDIFKNLGAHKFLSLFEDLKKFSSL